MDTMPHSIASPVYDQLDISTAAAYGAAALLQEKYPEVAEGIIKSNKELLERFYAFIEQLDNAAEGN